MNLTVHQFDLPLKHPFTISRESHTVQPTVIAELEQDGIRGFGEATTNAYYGVTSESLREKLESTNSFLKTISLRETAPATLWEELSTRLDDSFSLCALDQAAHDLWGKLHGKTVHQLWGVSMDRVPTSCFTIGIDTIEKMVEKLNEMPGWPSYKIKLGTDNDVEIVTALRHHTDAAFRVDANCGWTVEQTLRNAELLANLGVEFIEQPLAADDWPGHRTLFEKSALPIFADESCIVESDVARCMEHFHGINIKLVKCGGLTPARRMIAEAKAASLQVMVGCMTESTVGISAIAQLLPMLDYVDMDGAALLAKDIATGAYLEKGVCHFPKVAGSGVALLETGNP